MAHRAGSGDDGNQRRDAWLRQFLFAFANDEAEESTSFQGTIPQALMMMNGELMQDGALGQAGQLPGRRDASRPAGKAGRPKPTWSIPSTWRPSAGTRRPKSSTQARQYLEAFPDSLQVLQDLFWALLNSNEFVLIH